MAFMNLIIPAEKPFECETVKIKGVTYQNGFVPDNMHLKTHYVLKTDSFAHIELYLPFFDYDTYYYLNEQPNEDFIWKGSDTYDNSLGKEHLFCPVEKWDYYHSYYGDSENYNYFFNVQMGAPYEIGPVYNEYFDIQSADSEMVDKLIQFAVDNEYGSSTKNRAEIISLKTLYGYASPKENFSFGEVSFTYDSLALPIERKMAVDENYIYSYLLSDLEAENLGEISIDPIFTIPVNCDAIGMNKKTISVSRNGYLQTDIMGGRICTFYIGKENVEKFAREALEVNADKLLSNGEKTNNTAGFLNASPILPKDKTDLQKG